MTGDTTFYAFVIATLIETITPGPTMGLVLETRVSRGARAAFAITLGITVANIAGVLIAAFMHNFVVAPETAAIFAMLARDCAAGYLIYLASRRMLSSAVRFITRVDDTSAAHLAAPQSNQMFVTGFLVHLSNPVTLPYYLATFVRMTSRRPLQSVLGLGSVPVLSDFLVYAFAATYAAKRFNHVEIPPLAAGTFRLLAGVALLFLVAQTFAIGQPSDPSLEISATTTLVMLGGFLLGAIHEAQEWVATRRGKNNKLMWRVLSLWHVWFSVAVLVGALFTLIDGINGTAFALSTEAKSRIRICFVVAAVVGAALNFAKASGEVQDEQNPAESSLPAVIPTWQASPVKSGLAVLGLLVTVFGLLVLTDLRVH